MWRWIAFSVYAGSTKEIPLRALWVMYLAPMPGKLRVGRFSMNWDGVIVPVMFALLHATSFFKVRWLLALGRQIYAFILGVLYAYWLEKSHGLSDLVETLRVFARMGLL